MALPLRKFFTWWLYLLNVNFQTTATLAMTSTCSQNLSEDKLELLHSEYDRAENRGEALKNLTLHRARSINCMPFIKHFEVELPEPLKPGEGVGLTGDHKKLGEWQIDKSLEMKRRKRRPLKWYLKIPMCVALRIYYRFFIFYKDSKGFKRIRYWEGQQHARVLEAYEMFRYQGSQKFGHAHALAVGGGIQSERGWLRKEYIIQLKFIWPQHIRFTEFSHFIRKPKYILKLKAFSNDNELSSYSKTELEGDTEIQISRFESMKSKLKIVEEDGELYKPGDIVVFHITAADFQDNLYVLGIYSRQQELLGEVVIPAKVIKRSESILELPIFDVKANSRVGWLTLPFLRIEALPQALKFNMRAGFHHYWPYNWPTLDIGQRGLGRSYYYNSANAVENTIESFIKAQKENSDMVLLNVQLTKDYVPVVWHDFGFFTASTRHNQKLKGNDLSYVYIHDLTYQELLKKRVIMFIKGLMVEVTHLNTLFVPDKVRIFPQLALVYQHLPPTLGIVVEIKWPQLLSSGRFESLQSLDKNRYVNKILFITIEFGCGRPLIMASFDADICSILRYKQHIYPVIFLTSGQNNPWEAYADLRTHSLTNAIQFVQASDILGTAIYANEILPAFDNNDLNKAFDLQQLVFVWGDQLNDYSLLEHFRSQEMAGLIYDRIDTFMTEKSNSNKKRFGFFEAQELQRIFIRQCVAAGNTTIKEGPPDTRSPFWPRLRSLD